MRCWAWWYGTIPGARWLRLTKLINVGPVSTEMGDRSGAGHLSRYVTSHPG